MQKNLVIYHNVAALVAGLGVLFGGCKKPYAPHVPDANTNVLTVEGVINNGNDSTIFKVARTVNISAASAIKPELNAILTIEDEQSIVYTLADKGRGRYAAPSLALDNSKKYHLRIKTADGSVYLSDPEAVKNAPVVDDLNYRFTDGGMTIYASAHDASNSTRYYRWEYEETWYIETAKVSLYVTDGYQILPRTQLVNICYGSRLSTNVITATNVKLSQDVITDQAITTVPPNSEKLVKRYSILVKQYALSQAAFEFWTNMKKNTEDLGGIFDQQPSAPVGNIRCTTNPDLPVIGYVSVGTVQSRRIFVDKSELPYTYKYVDPNNCTPIILRYGPPDDVSANIVAENSYLIPLDKIIGADRVTIVGYTAVPNVCGDCTLKGTVTKPTFWK